LRCLAYSTDGLKLAVGYTTGGLRIWDLSTAKVVKTLPMPRGARAVAYSPDGKFLAVGSDDVVLIHETTSYQLVRQYAKGNDTVACLAFAPDGRTLAAGMFSGTIRLLDLAVPLQKGKSVIDIEPRMLEGHRGVVNAISWSINGRCLISAGFDKTVRVWEYVNGQAITNWPGHIGEVSAVAFHPSGRIVLSGSRDTTLLMWDLTGRGTAAKLPNPKLVDKDSLDELWKELASDNNVTGNAAIWTMATARDIAKYLKGKVVLVNPEEIKNHIKNLDHKEFKEREKASKALKDLKRWVEGVLTDTLKRPPSEEVRKRVGLLLKMLEGQDDIKLENERLRARRVIEILEQANTADARDLLRELARGAGEDNLRDMAQAALERASKQ